MYDQIPAYYYPTKKMILDDEQTFTQSLLLKISDKNFLAYNSVLDAFDFLSKMQSEISSRQALTVGFDYNNLKSQFLNPPLQEISVLIVDYYMPDMNGIEFLQQIYALPCKKLLITSEKDNSTAVDAFNQGVINGYVNKNDNNFLIYLQQMIKELEWKYFVDITKTIYHSPEISLDFLKNVNVVQAFKKFLIDNNIVKFCLLDPQGDFLAIDNKKNTKYFLVRSKAQLQNIALVAKEDGASLTTLKAIEKGQAIPFFYEKKFWEVPAEKWEDHLYATHLISHEPEIYIATLI